MSRSSAQNLVAFLLTIPAFMLRAYVVIVGYGWFILHWWPSAPATPKLWQMMGILYLYYLVRGIRWTLEDMDMEAEDRARVHIWSTVSGIVFSLFAWGMMAIFHAL